MPHGAEGSSSSISTVGNAFFVAYAYVRYRIHMAIQRNNYSAAASEPASHQECRQKRTLVDRYAGFLMQLGVLNDLHASAGLASA